MNTQRSVIYSKRHHALMGERIGIDILDTFRDMVESLVNEYDAATDYEDLSLEVFKIFAIEMPADADALAEALGKNLLGLHIDQLVFEGRAAGVNHKNFHFCFPFFSVHRKRPGTL
jgi:hypothetical protein